MKYLDAIELQTVGQKTRSWLIVTKEGVELGKVRFFPRWRCYAFHPKEFTLYEHQCMRDLADFCEARTKEWRLSIAARNTSP